MKLDPSRPVRWGILGSGRIAGLVGADIQASKDSEVIAVGSRDLDRSRTFAEKYDIPRWYGSYDDLLADDDVDVIYIATTHAQHHEQALRTIRAGKPLLVEKPFTLTAPHAGEVIDAARDRRVFCMEAMWMRTNPLIRKALEMIEEGDIGQPRSVFADLGFVLPYHPAHRLYDLSVGGGALLDLGIYPVTFAWLFLGEPERVRATGALAPTGADQTTAMQWEYPDDRFAHLSCTTMAPTPADGIVIGSEGRLTLSGPFHKPDRLLIERVQGRRIASDEIVHPQDGNGYGHEIAEVVRCLRAGLMESPLIPLDDTLAIMRLMDSVRAQIGVKYSADA